MRVRSPSTRVVTRSRNAAARVPRHGYERIRLRLALLAHAKTSDAAKREARDIANAIGERGIALSLTR